MAISKIPFKSVKKTPAVGDSYLFINGNFRVARRTWLGHKEDLSRLRRDNVFTSPIGKVKEMRNRMLDLLHTVA